MADKITTESTLNITTAYKDGDTRIIKLKNPSPYISTSAITELESLIKNGDGTNSLLIGDKRGSDFLQIDKVTNVTKSTITFDLGI